LAVYPARSTLIFSTLSLEVSKLTKTTFTLFRYVNDLYWTEDKTVFDFAELSEVLTGDEFGKSSTALATLIRKLASYLKRISPPIMLTHRREVLYILGTESLSRQQELALSTGEEKRHIRKAVISLYFPPVRVPVTETPT